MRGAFIRAPGSGSGVIETVTPFVPRRITHAFHDIDGTHSRIRDWVPVMTLVTGFTARYGMPPGSPEEMAQAMLARKDEVFDEAHRFAVESAGLSALTQMEWALRCARRLTGESTPTNEEIVRLIWQGEESFPDTGESADSLEKLAGDASLLFRAYEILLLAMGRDRNLAGARKDPEAWRIPGSMDFLNSLRDAGIRNYFITGAVVEHDATGRPRGTMAEEIEVLGYEVGPGKIIEEFRGSAWNRKLPKKEIMSELCAEKGIDPRNVLVVGDGRSEIAAGVALGCVTLSRLDLSARRAREIHPELKTNMIVENYEGVFPLLFAGEEPEEN